MLKADLHKIFGESSVWYKSSQEYRSNIVARLDDLLGQEPPPTLLHVRHIIPELVAYEIYLPTLKRLIRVALEQDPKLFDYETPGAWIFYLDMRESEPKRVRMCLLAGVPLPNECFNKNTFVTWPIKPSEAYIDKLVKIRNRLESYLTLWAVRYTCPNMPRDLRVLLVEYVKRTN